METEKIKKILFNEITFGLAIVSVKTFDGTAVL